MSRYYSFDEVYKEDEKYTVPGSLLNSINKEVNELRDELATGKETRKIAQLTEEVEELRLRDKNPALKDAWDQYQTLRGLTQKS